MFTSKIFEEIIIFIILPLDTVLNEVSTRSTTCVLKLASRNWFDTNYESIKHPDVVNAQSTTFIMGLLVASAIEALLVIGGVEINPGPLTPNEFVGNKQGKYT